MLYWQKKKQLPPLTSHFIHYATPLCFTLFTQPKWTTVLLDQLASINPNKQEKWELLTLEIRKSHFHPTAYGTPRTPYHLAPPHSDFVPQPPLLPIHPFQLPLPLLHLLRLLPATVHLPSPIPPPWPLPTPAAILTRPGPYSAHSSPPASGPGSKRPNQVPARSPVAARASPLMPEVAHRDGRGVRGLVVAAGCAAVVV